MTEDRSDQGPKWMYPLSCTADVMWNGHELTLHAPTASRRWSGGTRLRSLFSSRRRRRRNYESCLRIRPRLYTVSQKKQDTKLLPITSPNVNRFSKFFHWQTHW